MIFSYPRFLAAVLCVYLCGAGLGSAQTQTQAHARDFSPEFARFYELGLPVVTNAVYVMLNREGGCGVFNFNSGFDYNDSRYLYSTCLPLMGNAWMLKEDRAAGKGVFVENACWTVEVNHAHAWEKRKAARRRAVRAGDIAAVQALDVAAENHRFGSWKPADPKLDLEIILASLKRKKYDRDHMDWQVEASIKSHGWDFLDVPGSYASLFLSAIHFHRMGFANEANEIIGLTFDLADDPRAVLVEAQNILAGARYDEITAKFFIDGDWAAYGKSLRSFCAQFAAVRELMPAVLRLAEKVEARAARLQPAPPVGDGLTDEDRRLALELAAATRLDDGFAGIWILQPSDLRKPDSLLGRFQARGVKSVPLLRALIKDDTLIRVGHRASDYWADAAGTNQDIDTIYDSLLRPTSLSEIAIQMLVQLLNTNEISDSVISSVNRDALWEEVGRWYEQHKDQTPEELAVFYLQKGNGRQQVAALHYLINAGGEFNRATVETWLLELEGKNRKLFEDHGFSYVILSGTNASGFFSRYEARVNEWMKGNNDDAIDDARKERLARMREIVSATSVEQILEEILMGKKSLKQAALSLDEAMRRENPERLIPLLLDTVLKADTLELRVELLQKAGNVRWDVIRWSGVPVSYEGPWPEDEALLPAYRYIQATADLWKPFLADTRVADTDSGADSKPTVADIAAWSIETVYGDNPEIDCPVNRTILSWQNAGSRYRPALRARAEARVAGKPENELPPLPSADNVSAEQKQAIVDQLLKTRETKLEKVFRGLNVDYILAVAEEAEANDALNAKLAGLANRVNTVSVKTLKGKLPGKLKAWKGRKLDKAMVEQLLAISRQFVEEGRPIRIAVNRQYYLGGVDIEVVEEPALYPNGKKKLFRRIPGEAGVEGRIEMNDDISSSVDWPVGQNKGWKLEQLATTGIDEVVRDREFFDDIERTKFWKAVEALVAGQDNVCYSVSISFTGFPIQPAPSASGGAPAE